jgi:hypothetical protein
MMNNRIRAADPHRPRQIERRLSVARSGPARLATVHAQVDTSGVL